MLILDPTMNENPTSSRAFRLPAESIPASATTTTSTQVTALPPAHQPESGTSQAKARFLKVTGATKELDQGLIDRARQLAGLKGYVTNLPATTMDGQG